jgi:flavoprotein
MATYTITINVVAKYPHGMADQGGTNEVTMTGDGSIEWFIDAFRASLVASGYSGTTADQLQLAERMTRVEV